MWVRKIQLRFSAATSRHLFITRCDIANRNQIPDSSKRHRAQPAIPVAMTCDHWGHRVQLNYHSMIYLWKKNQRLIPDDDWPVAIRRRRTKNAHILFMRTCERSMGLCSIIASRESPVESYYSWIYSVVLWFRQLVDCMTYWAIKFCYTHRHYLYEFRILYMFHIIMVKCVRVLHNKQATNAHMWISTRNTYSQYLHQ